MQGGQMGGIPGQKLNIWRYQARDFSYLALNIMISPSIFRLISAFFMPLS